MTAALLALLLVAAEPGPAAKDAPPLEVLEAGQVEYDVANERGVATGGVVLRRGLVMLRAERAAYDLRTGEIDASGAVLLTEPGRVLGASAMHLVLDGPLRARDVTAFLKDTPLDLSRCRTLDEGRRTGRNRLTLRAEEGERPAPPPGEVEHLEAEHARVTLCDCGAGPPPWEVRARSADVIPGKRALLWWPVFYITPRFLFVDGQVPVFALPAMYLPLGDRQSGLLFPELSFGGVSGFGFSLPLYLTLGRSWDTTVTADYVFGPTQRANGPGSSFELRWAPVEGMHGVFRLSVLHPGHLDLRDPGQWPAGIATPPGGNRIALSGMHEQRVSDRTYYRIELGLIDDPLYLSDFTGDALLRATQYRRSALAVTHRRDDAVLAFDAAYHLPLTNLDSGGGPYARAPFGAFGADLSTFQRLPSASFTLLPVRLAGPVHLSAVAGVARFAPLRGATGDEGRDGIGPGELTWGLPGTIDPGERDGRWDGPGAAGPGERLAATRALVRAELRAPMTWRSVVDVEPWLATTAAAYAFEAALDPRATARLSGGLALSTRVGRTFGDGPGRVRHEIEPRVEWRGGTGEAGSGLPNYAYDEFDVALPRVVLDPSGTVAAQRTLSAIPGSFSQVQLSVRNRLIAPAGPLSSTFLDLTLGQDLDASSGTASETWARASIGVPHVSASAAARWRAFGAAAPPGTPTASAPSRLDAFTELSGSLIVADARGDNVHATFTSFGAGASPRVVAGLEPFFDPRPYGAQPTALGTVGLGARWSGAIFSYDALFYGRDIPTGRDASGNPVAPTCPNGKAISTAPHVYQHQASLVWDSPCRCWKMGVTAILNECDDRPRFGLILDFSAIGGRAVSVGR